MPEHTPAPTPARSLYGFFMFLFSKIILFMYCIWATIPDYYLHYFNIYYYPQKYWSVAIPVQCLVGLTIFAFLIYPSSNLMLTVTNSNINSIIDKCSRTYENVKNPKSHLKNTYCICNNETTCMKNTYLASNKELMENTVPQLLDLDIRSVSKKLYLCK